MMCSKHTSDDDSMMRDDIISNKVRKRSRSDEKSKNERNAGSNDSSVSDDRNNDNSCTKTKSVEEVASSFSTLKQEGGREPVLEKAGKVFANEEKKYRRERRLAMNRKTAKIRRDRAIDRLEQLKTTCNDLMSRNDILQKENEVLRERRKEAELILEKQNIDYKGLLAKKNAEARVVLARFAESTEMQEQDQLAFSSYSDAFSKERAESSFFPQSIYPTPQTSLRQESFEGDIYTTGRERAIFAASSIPLSTMATPITTGIMNQLPFLDSVTNQQPSLLGMNYTTPQNFSSSFLRPNQSFFDGTNQGLLPTTQDDLQQIMAPQLSLMGGGTFPSRQENNIFQQAVPPQYDMLHTSNSVANNMLLGNATNFQPSNLFPMNSCLGEATSTQSGAPRYHDETTERDDKEQKEEEEIKGKAQTKI